MSNRDWPWERVKAEVRIRRGSLRLLASDLGYSTDALSLLNTLSMPRAQSGIAQFLGLQPQQIWPSRYDAAGNPIRKRRSDAGKPKPGRRTTVPQKEEANFVCE